MGQINAIETVYNGYRFRSRLEARWAVFFDAAGIKYQYEPEGFEVKDFYEEGEVYRYLPDFFLPQFDCYAEVKPNKEKLEDDGDKLSMMIDFNNSPISKGLLILGQIPILKNRYVPQFAFLYWSEGVCFKTVVIQPSIYTWHCEPPRLWCYQSTIRDCTTCPDFPAIDIGDDLYELNDIWALVDNIWFRMSDVHQRKIAERLTECFDRARQARFEHGEKP